MSVDANELREVCSAKQHLIRADRTNWNRRIFQHEKEQLDLPPLAVHFWISLAA